MYALRIVLLAVAAAVGYGIIHDQITARICLEYFTVAHPPIFATESPTLLGIGWGVVATWWVGLPLGILLAGAARLGHWPQWSARQLWRPVLVLLGAMAICAVLAGVAGGVLAASGRIQLPAYWASRIPAPSQTRFLVDAWAHNASYLSGMVGGLALTTWTVLRRRADTSTR